MEVCQMCGNKMQFLKGLGKAKEIRRFSCNKVRCVDPFADGFDAFGKFDGKGNRKTDTSSKFDPGTIGWYLFHEGFMIAKNGYPPAPFAFLSGGDFICNPVKMSGQYHNRRSGGAFDRRHTGSGKIYQDDEALYANGEK